MNQIQEGTQPSKPSTSKTEDGDKETGSKGKKKKKNVKIRPNVNIELVSKPSMVDDGDF